jgi:dihydropteroate synthase
MNDNYSYHFGKKVYDLSSRTFVMGVLNVTPDSFSDGGKFTDVGAAISHAKKMVDEGADFVEVGGQSTRPGADEVSVDEEIKRVVPVIKELAKIIDIPISVDTYRSEVADEALNSGALIVNDVSGFNSDPNILKVIAKHKATAIAMHMKGTPKNMQDNPQYNDVVKEVIAYFEDVVWKVNIENITQLILDPGIGFGKNVEHNLKLIKNIAEIKRLDCPVMVGISRKSMIGKLVGGKTDDRLEGTVALNTISILNGVQIIRVHEVKAGVRTAGIVDEYKKISKF